MNAKTAAVIDFQKPLQVKNKSIKIHFSSRLDECKKNELSWLFTHHLNNWRSAEKQLNDAEYDSNEYFIANFNTTYNKCKVLGILSCLQIMGAITEKEANRLEALFSKQPDLFTEQQAA